MLKERRTAAMKVAESLWAAEDALDAALVKAAEFNSTLATARMDAKLSAVVGQDAFEGAAAAFASIVRARADLVETHKRLSETKVEIGLRTMAMGELGKPPAAQEGQHLKVVA